MTENIKQIESKLSFNKFKIISTEPNSLKFKTFATKTNRSKNNNIQFENKKNIKFLSQKIPYFKVDNCSDFVKKNSSLNSNYNNGRWSEEEKNKFLQGIVLYGINWKKVKTLIPTRTAIQVRSHAQKFFHKMKLCKDLNLGIDFTLHSICNLKDMINQIKTVNPEYNILEIFKHLSFKFQNRRKFKIISKNYMKNNNENEVNDLICKEDKNIYLNQNNDIKLNTIEQFNEKIKINEKMNNSFNINYLQNNCCLFDNINFMNNNNNYNNIQNILNNIHLLNALNNLSSNNNFNLNNHLYAYLINYYLSTNSLNIPFFNYLSQIGNLLVPLRAQNFNSFNPNANNNISDIFNQLNLPINNIDIDNNNSLPINNLLLKVDQKKENNNNENIKNIENKKDY